MFYFYLYAPYFKLCAGLMQEIIGNINVSLLQSGICLGSLKSYIYNGPPTEFQEI